MYKISNITKITTIIHNCTLNNLGNEKGVKGSCFIQNTKAEIGKNNK